MSDEITVDPDQELGPCCTCGYEGQYVRNIIMLPKRGAVAGHGWGCFVCGLPMDGASYVQCDNCFAAKLEPTFACAGYPGIDGRVLIGELTEPFDHDMSKHGGRRCAMSLT